MTKLPIPRRIQHLETEVAILKRSVTGQPDFSIDEQNWEKVRKTVKRTRRQLYRHA